MEAVLPTACADEDAMLRVAAGDNRALAWLFDRHKTRLFGFLYHLVGDRPLAEDLLGDTFLRVYQARGRYRAGSAFVPWLYSIARNLAVGELRRRGCLLRVHQRLTREAADETEEWEVDREELRERVRIALLHLPEEQRTALVLKEYAGLSYREIAQAMGGTEEGARARAYRARAAMREELRDYCAEE